MSVRTALAGLALLVALGAGGCGRRGPPLPPLQVDPETPQLFPLRQEGGQVVIRWHAPRLSSDGSVEELRLRKAVVSYRVVDILELAAEERAARRAGPGDEEESAEPLAEGEDPEEGPEPEPTDEESTAGEPSDPEAPEGAAADMEPQEAPPAGEPEEAPPEGEPEEAALEGELEEAPPEGELPEAAPEGGLEAPPEAEPGEAAAEVEEEAGPPATEAAAPESEPEPAAAPPPDAPPGAETPGDPAAGEPVPPGPEPEEEQETQEEPDVEAGLEGDPPAEESGEPSEPPAEPEPAGSLLDYEELEFELLSEVESEIRGEERTLELPVEPDWVGRRLEVRVRYEARGGASEESEPQALDVTAPLPVVEEVSVEVGQQAVTVRWRDPRPDLQTASPLADPVFEVFRRRGGEEDRVGRSVGPTFADSDLVWGEEVCYRARLVLAGGDDERVLPDPGPEMASIDPELMEGAPAAPGEETEGEASGSESGTVPAPAAEASGEGAEAAAASSESETAPWTPIPIRVPGTGSSALSVGPASAEACVVPFDTFPPVPPSDLRLFWQAERTDLSWRESASADVVGYHVYRSDPDGAGFERLTLDPVEETVFGDASRDPRGNYRYAVTAVDAADPPNESLPSDSRRVIPR